MKTAIRLIFCALAMFSMNGHAATYFVNSIGNYTSKTDYTSCTTAPTIPCTNYSLSQNTSGSFSTSVALAPNLSLIDITGMLTSFSFNDGMRTYARTDPNVRVLTVSVSTDAQGTITAALIILENWLSAASPHIAGDRFAIVQIFIGVLPAFASKTGNLFQLPVKNVAPGAGPTSSAGAANNYPCSTVGISAFSAVADACTNGTPDAATSLADGALVSFGGVSIPTLSEWGMVILSLLMVGGAFVATRRTDI